MKLNKYLNIDFIEFIHNYSTMAGQWMPLRWHEPGSMVMGSGEFVDVKYNFREGDRYVVWDELYKVWRYWLYRRLKSKGI